MNHLLQLKLRAFQTAWDRIDDKGFITSDPSHIAAITKEWLEFISFQSERGLVPLFITGTGASQGALITPPTSDTTKPDLFKNIPNIYAIMEELEGILEREKASLQLPDVDALLHEWNTLKIQDKKDRTIVARIFDSLQDTEDQNRKELWKKCTKKLLYTILFAQPTKFHSDLSTLYKRYNAVCLTLNFDGLLIKKLRSEEGFSSFSLPTKEECERYFTRLPNNNPRQKELAEIQLRGDILYLKCDNSGFCPQKENPVIPFFQPKSERTVPADVLNCPNCGHEMTPYLSFPGSHKKEKDMRDILQVVWKYLSYSVGSVTMVGVSGDWDPLIIAFLGDLLNERDIPLLIVEKSHKLTSAIRELVLPKQHYALAVELDSNLLFNLDSHPSNGAGEPHQQPDPLKHRDEFMEDHWDKPEIISPKDEKQLYEELNGSGKIGFTVFQFERKLRDEIDTLELSSQLGMKTEWIVGEPQAAQLKYHDRLHHSIGVMKIASYLYRNAFKNEHFNENEWRFLRIAALLHDIGHLPFSHMIEEVFNELNWTPGLYKTSYSHVLQTEKRIKQIFRVGSDFETHLTELGYDVDDLIRLINGNYGVGFLDAIINSAIDADKIDYIFSDTDVTRRRVSLTESQFLKDIASELSVTPQGFLAFSGVSARAAFDLLKARRHLYQNLYLSPSMRVLEGIAKHIITTYFLHEVNLRNLDIKQTAMDAGSLTCPDLGLYKILESINHLEKLQKSEKPIRHDKGTEWQIIDGMYEKLQANKLLNPVVRKSISQGYELITTTRGESALKEIERRIKRLTFNGLELYNKVSKNAKTCKLRMPGRLIIEVVQFPKFLSIADERNTKLRSDNTKTFSECIVVPPGNAATWYASQKAGIALLDSTLKDEESKGFNVYIYPLLGGGVNPYEDPNIKQAMNLFNRLMEQESIIEEAE